MRNKTPECSIALTRNSCAPHFPPNPATTAAQTARTTARTKSLRKKLAKIDVAETALITELETPADPAAQALRNRIRARFTELYAERTAIQNDLAALDATSDEPAARVSGQYFYHMKRRGADPAAANPAIQDRLLAQCAELSGVPFPA